MAILITVATVLIFALAIGSFALIKKPSNNDEETKAKIVAKMIELSEDGDDKPTSADKKQLECIIDEVYGKINPEYFEELLKTKTATDTTFSELQKLLTKGDLQEFEKAFDACPDPELSDDNSSTSTTEPVPEPAYAKTSLRNAITAVKSIQTGLGDVNFSGITLEALRQDSPDLKWTNTPLNSDATQYTIAVSILNSDEMVMKSRDDNDICYYVRLAVDDGTLYGSSITNNNEPCPQTAGINGGVGYTNNTTQGWANPGVK